MSQWLDSLGKPASSPLLQPSLSEVMGPHSSQLGMWLAFRALIDDICYGSDTGCHSFSTSPICL